MPVDTTFPIARTSSPNSRLGPKRRCWRFFSKGTGLVTPAWYDELWRTDVDVQFAPETSERAEALRPSSTFGAALGVVNSLVRVSRLSSMRARRASMPKGRVDPEESASCSSVGRSQLRLPHESAEEAWWERKCRTVALRISCRYPLKRSRTWSSIFDT